MHRMLALAHFHAGDFEASLAEAEAAVRLHDVTAAAILSAALVKLGRLDEAQTILTPELYERIRSRSGASKPYAAPADRRSFIEAVRLAAAGPEALAR
jgi:hypothetical protein